MSRAENRHNRRKKIREIERRNNFWDAEWSERMIRIVARTPKPCSCWMCGNPRRFGSGDKYGDQKKCYEDKIED
jgi:hypothetical protein